ncbi:5-dehydro-2-deoxygluconokinase [Vallitalea pronyensis]|uniref:5-dehydro-2-deoxygluconokinase n=1 Tax=Vallitalea pronyensis TaxID=1348613 RepID=A0A8J8MH53_9FIRM|nr:5-dehydro-2-deoxygluconokinase [Vallitalea pronyensis]QUI21158.1 5-dehydro-2-deoxygluconokinase [Vallitalea pronyensis]
MKEIIFQENREMDVVAIGRIGIDLNPNEYNRPLEDTLTFTKTVGGSPANIAVATSRYGIKTGFIGRIADDAFGRYIVQYFKAKGIDTGGLVVDSHHHKTGLAFVEIKSPNDSDIIMYRSGAVDLQLTMDDIREDYIKETKALVISGTALAASPSREAVFLAIKLAKKHKTITVFDVDYRPYTWHSMKETSLYCSMAASMCDVIIGTREEFDVIEGVDIPDNQDDQVTADYWLAEQPQLIIVKRGREGSTAYLKSGESFVGEVFPVEALKTQGAGDSFAGGVISSLIKGKDIVEAMRYGAGAAAIVVQKNSCSEAMPTEKEIHDFIASYRGGRD